MDSVTNLSANTPRTKRCDGCGAKEKLDDKLKCCVACKKALYCNKECQKKHWWIHKKYCKQATSSEYKVKANKNIQHVGKIAGIDDVTVVRDSDGRIAVQFHPSSAPVAPFVELVFHKSKVNPSQRYGYPQVGCEMFDQTTPTKDVTKLLFQSFVALVADASVMITTPNEDEYHYLFMRNGRRFVKADFSKEYEKKMKKATSESQKQEIIMDHSMQVLKVEFCLGNSNTKIFQFFGHDYEKIQTLTAVDVETIAGVKRHLEKYGTKTEKEIFCVRGRSRIMEGYIDFQNID